MTSINKLMNRWIKSLSQQDRETLCRPDMRNIAVRNFEIFSRDEGRRRAADRVRDQLQDKSAWKHGGKTQNGMTIRRHR